MINMCFNNFSFLFSFFLLASYFVTSNNVTAFVRNLMCVLCVFIICIVVLKNNPCYFKHYYAQQNRVRQSFEQTKRFDPFDYGLRGCRKLETSSFLSLRFAPRWGPGRSRVRMMMEPTCNRGACRLCLAQPVRCWINEADSVRFGRQGQKGRKEDLQHLPRPSSLRASINDRDDAHPSSGRLKAARKDAERWKGERTNAQDVLRLAARLS